MGSAAVSSSKEARILGKKATKLGSALSTLTVTAEEQKARIAQLEKQLAEATASSKAAINFQTATRATKRIETMFF